MVQEALSLDPDRVLRSEHRKQDPALLRPPPSLTILLVDDDPVNLKVATLMLEQQQHRVKTATDGQKAIDALENGAFDLVFMDVSMQNMDGYEATRIIREREKATQNHVPIIALTALVFKDDRQKCLDAGMDAYVAKPFKSENLAEAITSIFDARVKGTLKTPIEKEPPSSSHNRYHKQIRRLAKIRQ